MGRLTLVVFTVVGFALYTGVGAGPAAAEKAVQGQEKKPKKKKGPKIRSVKLNSDDGVVFGPGTVVHDGSGMKVDLVAHKHGAGLDLKAGRQGTSYLPLHSFGSQTFEKLKMVPCVAPADSEKNAMISTPEKGQAFTVRGNKTDGVWRVRVKAVQGGEVKLQYQECK